MRRHTADSLTISVEETAELLGISRSLAYELANTNRLPAPVIRLGRRLVVSKVALDRALATTPQMHETTSDNEVPVLTSLTQRKSRRDG